MFEINNYIDDNGLFDGRYFLLRQLSTEGGTADVWLAEDKDTEDEELSEDNDEDIVKIEGTAVLVAIKIYRPKNILDAEGIQTFKKEYKTVYNCHHANLLKPSGFSIIDDSVPYLVIPFCEKGSVESLIGKLTESEDLWKFIYDTASGLAYLHSCSPSIIHQDIKPANILVDSKNNYCITDFGISVKGNDYLDDIGSGTIRYMPPERFEEGYEPNPKSDIWSLGATFFELITGDVPFGEKGGERQSEGEEIPEVKAKIPKRIKTLIYECLDANPDKRPSAETIAEIARKKGEKYPVINALVLFSFLILLSGIIIWSRLEKQDEMPFITFCDSGDSIINIEKDNAKNEMPIDSVISRKRLNEAVCFYTMALKEDDYIEERRDSIKKRIQTIHGMTTLFDTYEGVLDSLNIAIDVGAEIQTIILKDKRDVISNKIKNIILTL